MWLELELFYLFSHLKENQNQYSSTCERTDVSWSCSWSGVCLPRAEDDRVGDGSAGTRRHRLQRYTAQDAPSQRLQPSSGPSQVSLTSTLGARSDIVHAALGLNDTMLGIFLVSVSFRMRVLPQEIGKLRTVAMYRLSICWSVALKLVL